MVRSGLRAATRTRAQPDYLPTRHGALSQEDLMKTSILTLPKMRKHDLIVDELPDEVLVYDVKRDRAHCLNRTAALVWERCDGHTTPAEIARRLPLEFDADGLPQAEQRRREELVWLALGQLNDIDLLEQTVTAPAEFARLSRRQMIRGLGLAAAVAVPVITSIVAPTAVQAATCLAPGAPCPGATACCNPQGCNPGLNQCK
jgi:hypothetical protein